MDNFCLVDPTKTIKDDKEVLARFLAAPNFISRLDILQPILDKQFKGFNLQSLWPKSSDSKDGKKSELYRLAGNKAFSKRQSRKDIFVDMKYLIKEIQESPCLPRSCG